MAKTSRSGGEPPEVKRLRAHARHLLLIRRRDLAEPVLRQLLASRPGESGLHRDLAGCLLGLRRTDEACAAARTAVSLDPSSPAALTMLGAVHMVLEQHDEAAAALEQALRLKPDYPPAIFGLAATTAGKGGWPDALVWADRGLALQPDHVGLLRIRGQALATAGRRDDAIAAMEQFLQLAPADVECHRAAAVVMRRLGRTAEASAFAERAMQLDPADPDRHNHLAMLKLKERKFDDADRHYKSAAEIYGSRQEGQRGSAGIELRSLLGQAAVSLNRRRFGLAEQQYRRILEIEPTRHVAAALLAATIGVQNRFDEAIGLAQKAMGDAPTAEVPKRMFMVVLCHMERYDEAVSVANDILEQFPNSAETLQLLALVYIDLGECPKAFELVEKALSIKPSPSMRRTRLMALAGLGRTVEAIEAVGRSLGEEKDTFSAEEAAGYAHYLLGNLAQAETHLRRAMELDESGLGGHGWLGLVYVKQGRPDLARPLLEAALMLNPHQRRVRAALAALATLADL